MATQAQAPATQAHTLAAQAQVLAAQAQPPATQVQALATQAHTLAAQAQVLAAQALVAPNYDVDTAEKNVPAYKQIAILQDINLHYPIHKLALEEWQRTVKNLSNSISRKKGQSNDLINQIYTILGIFAVFQGVVLSAVSQLKQTAHPELKAHPEFRVVPVCGKIWFPIVLTIFATVATLGGIADKFKSLRLLEHTIHAETQAHSEVDQQATWLCTEGPQKFKFHLHANNSTPVTEPELGNKRFLVFVILLIFMLISILSYFVILCDLAVIRKWDGGFHR